MLCIYRYSNDERTSLPKKNQLVWKKVALGWTEIQITIRVMVFNATFNNISVISWRSVLLTEETGENHPPVASH